MLKISPQLFWPKKATVTTAAALILHSIWPSEFDRHTDNRDQSPVDKSVWYFVTSSMNRYIDEAAKYSHEISHLTVCLTANPKRDRIFFRLCWMILMVQSTVIFPPPAPLEKKITFSVVVLLTLL